jgi:hypothetical protein
LGWDKIQVVKTALAGSEATAYAIADNRTAELAEWNYEELGAVIRSLQAEDFDLSVLGFADHELEPLLAADWSPQAVGALPGTGGAAESDHAVVFSPATWGPVKEAIDLWRETFDSLAISEPEAIEAICTEYLDSRREPN